MKPWMIKLLIGVAGFAGGFASGFLVHKKMNDVEFLEISEEEMAEIEKEVQNNKKDNVVVETTDKVPLIQKDITSETIGAAQKLPDDPDAMRNVLQGKTPYMKADEDQKKAYEKLWKATADYSTEDNANHIPIIPVLKPVAENDEEDEDASPEEDEFDEEFLEQLEQEAVEAGNDFAHPPYQIDLAGFWNDHPEFDHVTIQYYEPDNVWLDENDEIIADISSYIGTNKDLFKTPGMDNDEDVRFICNEQYGTNYEIIRHHRSYAETVGEGS